MKYKLVLIIMFLLLCINNINAQPSFDNANNSKSDDRYPIINISETIIFNISTSGGNDVSHVWTIDGTTSQTNNTVSDSQFTTSFTSRGIKNVSITANNGTSPATFSWFVNVLEQKTTAANQVTKINVTAVDDLTDAVEEGDYSKFLFASTIPYTNILGSFFYLILFGLPLLMVWISQERKEIPMAITILFATVLFVFIPGPFRAIIMLLAVLGIVVIIYTRYKERGQ